MNLIRYQYKKLTFEKKHYMKLKIFTLLIFVAMFSVQQVYSQDISASQLNSVNIDELSDDQISKYWDKAKAEGYSIEQLEVILESRGTSLSQISKLKQRITALRYADVNTTSSSDTTTQNDISNLEKFGLEGKVPEKEKDNLIFGYDFFTNPNISFTPNINLATPATCQLGPGDELLIDIWGARGLGVCSMTKSALDTVGKVYANELSSKYIRVNTLQPGFVETDMVVQTEKILTKEVMDAVRSKYPLGYGKPKDIALPVIFLLSNASKWITGQSIVIDGGRSSFI
jgi:NAD(P)-dependent dehydrogenase (short-subunit alcohol dehydrogenase family)